MIEFSTISGGFQQLRGGRAIANLTLVDGSLVLLSRAENRGQKSSGSE
jgi:hypothetical protein